MNPLIEQPKTLHPAIWHLPIEQWRRGEWWERNAYLALSRGWYRVIPKRRSADLYLLRCWLTKPERDVENSKQWSSDNGLMLHYFACGDDDEALHDHPWDFETELLHGRYDEHTPPFDWKLGDQSGPAWNANIDSKFKGDVIQHRATDLHCVGYTEVGTWTLVRTGPRVRDWGFHPQGQPWIQWRKFLGLEQPAASAST